ncbi:hypothetical protein V1264_006502 [Littorina saxatilis]|uniref:Uncharacterized protein n=2 Tax=Littorina saxatilis TaxID=31220 RepID=A0AAN9G4K5_9CAEN
MKTMFPSKKVQKVGFLLALCCLPLYLLSKIHQARHVSGVAGVKVLLMTKGRSGSSLTSDIIHAHGGVFYTFEPLPPLMLRRHVEDRQM